jgi:hypothetical protein
MARSDPNVGLANAAYLGRFAGLHKDERPTSNAEGSRAEIDKNFNT